MEDIEKTPPPETHLRGEAIEGAAHERGVVAACKALGHEGVYISGATLRRAIAAYLAALATEGHPDAD